MTHAEFFEAYGLVAAVPHGLPPTSEPWHHIAKFDALQSRYGTRGAFRPEVEYLLLGYKNTAERLPL